MFFRPKARQTLIRLSCALLSVALVLFLLAKRQESVEERNRLLLNSEDQWQGGPDDQVGHGAVPAAVRRPQLRRHGLRSAAPAGVPLSAKDQQLFHRLNPFNESWGANGRPVDLSSPEERKAAEQLFKLGAFNVYISDRIAPNRSLPEARPSECAAAFDDLSDPSHDHRLPTASVIIIFTDEIWSALVRTIWSVWNRSPDHLLKEVILVDDFSKRDELKQPLDLYVRYYFGDRVKVLRTPRREGLIRARIMGAKQARGDVLIFLVSPAPLFDRRIPYHALLLCYRTRTASARRDGWSRCWTRSTLTGGPSSAPSLTSSQTRRWSTLSVIATTSKSEASLGLCLSVVGGLFARFNASRAITGRVTLRG